MPRLTGASGDVGSGWDRELAGQREVLAQRPRMACRDAKQGERRPLWHPTPSLPVAERMDADTEGDREGPLRESGEAPEGGNVRPTLEFASHEAVSEAPGHG